MFSQLVSAILLMSTSIVVYFMVLLTSVYYYYDYLRGKLKSLAFYAIIILIFASALLLIISPFINIVYLLILSYSNAFIATLAFTLPLLPLLLRVLKYRCRNETVKKINNVEFVICEMDNIINAWYNAKENKIIITDKFYKVLTENELKAIIMHEMGHKRSGKYINLVHQLVTTCWYMITVSIALILSLAFKYSTDAVALVSLIGFFAPFTPAVTVLAMSWSWIQEHECDIYALKKVNYEALISALIKVYTYSSVSEYLKYINNISINKKVLVREIEFSKILRRLFRLSWDVPLWYIEVLKRPTYLTHPPLELRLLKIINEI